MSSSSKFGSKSLFNFVHLGEFVLNDEQRDSCLDMANEIAMYKNCKINFSLQFDCDEIDDCSDLLDATDFEGTYDES